MGTIVFAGISNKVFQLLLKKLHKYNVVIPEKYSDWQLKNKIFETKTNSDTVSTITCQDIVDFCELL